jgi:AcrR family transcriptional regulator
MPGESGRSGTRKELVEAEILQHAVRLFAERGFAGTSLQDVASAAGLTRPALYYYVTSKDDLLERLVHQVIDDAADRLHAIVADETLSPSDQLRELVKAFARRQLADPKRFQLLIRSEAELPEALASIYLRGRRRVLDAFVAVIRRGVATEEFRNVDVRTAAFGVIGTCNWIAWWYHPGDGPSEDAIAEQYADFAVAGLAANKRRGAQETGLRRALSLLREDVERFEREIEAADPTP